MGEATRVPMPMAAAPMVEAYAAAFKTTAPDVHAAHVAPAAHVSSTAVASSSFASDR